MSKREERMKHMLKVIEQYNNIPLRDLASIENVSPLTIRRDIEEMEKLGYVQNIRGEVFFRGTNGNADEYLLSIATSRHAKEKKAIGECAAKMINPDDFVIIDNGTTTEQLSASIPYNIRATFLCYNLNVVNNLYRKPNISLIFCGGYFHEQTLMFECPESLDIIRRSRANKVFVSAAGIHEKLGVTCVSEYELANKREIIKAGAERILLLDSSKFGIIKPCFVGEIEVFDTIITDSGVSDEWASLIQDKGVNLIIA